MFKKPKFKIGDRVKPIKNISSFTETIVIEEGEPCKVFSISRLFGITYDISSCDDPNKWLFDVSECELERD